MLFFVFDIKDRWYIGYSNQTIKIVDSIVDISCKPASKILSLENKAGKFLFWAKLVLQFLIYNWKIDSRNLRTSQFGPKAKKTSHDWERSGILDWEGSRHCWGLSRFRNADFHLTRLTCGQADLQHLGSNQQSPKISLLALSSAWSRSDSYSYIPRKVTHLPTLKGYILYIFVLFESAFWLFISVLFFQRRLQSEKKH